MPTNIKAEVAKGANIIIRNNLLSKKEKIKQLFYHFRLYFPNDTQDELFQLSLDYYEYKMDKKN
jgi:hypothetical protein